jgi:hypothetical protein
MRALFIGGPIAGQMRDLEETYAFVTVEAVRYMRLFAYGIPMVTLYSVVDIAESMERLWSAYVQRCDYNMAYGDDDYDDDYDYSYDYDYDDDDDDYDYDYDDYDSFYRNYPNS